MTRRTIDPGLGGADLVWTWTYDNAAGKGKGLIAREAGLSGFQKVYTYDSLSRLSRVAVTIAGSTYTSSTDYDTYGRVKKIHYPDSFWVENFYSTSNYDLYQVRDSDSHTWWDAEDYDYAGRIIEYDLAGTNMTATTTLLAGSSFIKEVRSKRGMNDLLHMEYDFDNHGNLTWRKDTSRRHEEEFTYDNLNRLDQQRQKTSGGSWGSWTNLADYDNLGNITAKAGVTGSFTYGSTRPHAVTSVGGVNYTYNNNGNVKLRGDHPIWWTAFNKPLSIFSDDASYSFYYDNDFNRIIETIYGEGFSRVKINPSALYQVEIEDGVKTRRRHIPTPVGVVGVSNYDESDNTTTRRYFLKDHLGSSSVVADDSGTVQSNYSYDAWGNPRNASNWSALSAWPDYEADEGFTGHEMMSSLELVHMNGRVYDPLIGRFLSPDIFIQAEGNLQNYNRYSYVLNNPLKYVDPSGNEFFTFFATIIAIGEGLGGYELFLLFFTAGFLDAYVESGDVGVSLKAGLISGTSAYFAHEIGTWFKDGWAANAFNSPTLANVVKATFHGVRGGIAAELSGGEFGAGAGAAFFGDYGGGLAGEYIGEGLIVSAILGGTASEIGGGKFSNGALSGAMTFVLSTAIHQEPSQSEKAQATSLGSKSELGNALRKIPILGGILGGVGDILSGAGNVALDKFNQGFSQIGGGFSRTIGSIWALPNSIVGLAYGAIGIPFGAKLHWDSNNTILQVTNHPFMLGAMSLGDVNVFGRLVPPSTMGPFGFTVGQEEALHSIQSRILGPLYFPAHILGGIKSWFTPPGKAPYPGLDFWHRNNFMENGPMNGRVF